MVLPLPVRTALLATFSRAYSALLAVLSRCSRLTLLSGCLLGLSPGTTSQAETVLLDFSSPTCGPCQEMRPVVRRLLADGLPVREIDVSREPQVAARYGVTRVPTFLVVVDGKPVEQVVGPTTYERLHQMLRRAMPVSPPLQPALPLGQSPDTLAAPTPSIPALDEGTPAVGRGGSHHERLLAATVKITVDDAQGKSAGTGTIVDARSGEALILTCGHIFRSSDGKGTIHVTTFHVTAAGATPSTTYRGHLIDFDLDRDLALVSIRPTAPVAAVSIAGESLTPGAAVTSVGCNHGQNPTPIDSQVTTINRYQGPPNVEVAGAPVEGRSGGGLFNAFGELVGVCFAADPAANEGLYAALPSIRAKLDSLQLTMIYQPNSVVPPADPMTLTGRSAPRPKSPTAVRGQDPEPSLPLPSQPARLQSDSSLPTPIAGLQASERAALEEIQRRGANSEVICIIRPQDPAGQSEVITLRNVSPAFVRALATPRATTAGAPQRSAAPPSRGDSFRR